jgi:hypothetical protein
MRNKDNRLIYEAYAGEADEIEFANMPPADRRVAYIIRVARDLEQTFRPFYPDTQTRFHYIIKQMKADPQWEDGDEIKIKDALENI